jgi:uncharacterized protein YbaR (Trm112 family)
MSTSLIDIMVCPNCKGALRQDRSRNELVCAACRLAYPVRDGIPVMLEAEARHLEADEQA